MANPVNPVLAANAAPPAAIPAPPLTLPPLSLIQVARFYIDEEGGVIPQGAEDGRWQAGVTFRREPTGKAGGWAPCGGANIPIADDCDGGAWAAPESGPVFLPFFATYASRAPLDQWLIADYQGRAERGLRAHEAFLVEQEFWAGVLQPNNPFLANATGLTGAAGYDVGTPGSPVGLRDGLAMLDQAIADADAGIGMIHLTPSLLESLTTRGGTPVVREGGRILTVNGNWIVPGYGYTGKGPGGDGAGQDAEIQWAFATDMVYLGRGTIQAYPEKYPTNFEGEAVEAESDFVQSLVNAGTQVPMAAQWVAMRPWIYMTNGALRAGVKINATIT